MTTVLDLAERHGMNPRAVRAWLRQRGLIGKKGDRVTTAAEAQFRKAHGGSVMLEVAFADSAPAPAPAPTGATPRRPSRPRREVGLVAEQQNERYYKKRYDDLHAAYVEARDAAQAVAAERDRLQARVDDLRERLEARGARPAAPSGPTLMQALAARGVERDVSAEAVVDLLAEPERAWALLNALRLHDAGALEGLNPVCSDALCQRCAAATGWVPVKAPAHGCSVCAGRPTQRAYRWMALRLAATRRLRLTIVGGSDQTHAELRALATLAPDLKQRLVDGTTKTTRQQARSHCRGSDVVVIWGATRLDHAVSQLYKDEALAAEHVVLVPVKDGARGVQALARAVAEAVG